MRISLHADGQILHFLCRLTLEVLKDLNYCQLPKRHGDGVLGRWSDNSGCTYYLFSCGNYISKKPASLNLHIRVVNESIKLQGK